MGGIRVKLFKETVDGIRPVDEGAKQVAKEQWDKLLKPLGSLGTLEDIAIKIAGIRGEVQDNIDKKAIVVMSSDNGVYEEGISSSPRIFTVLLAEAMVKGITGVATLAKFAKSDIVTVDIGMDSDYSHEDLINRKIAYGTKNFYKEPAMTREEAIRSIEVGIEIGDDLFKKGYKILGTGELGMGNTTTSSAILSAFSGLDPKLTCGVGGGLTKDQLENKIRVVRESIEKHRPKKEDPIDVLSKLGGFDIGGMCGLYLSAAKNRRPIVMDGFISGAAALCAIKINPLVREYIIPSHLSKEPGAIYLHQQLDIAPMLDLKMRLGEGSGCPLAFQVIESSLFALNNMGTFKDATIDSSILLDMRTEKL